MTKKHSFTFIKKEFEKHGYILLENGYINAHTKLHYICPKGHKHSITWNHWREGHRCPYCASQGQPDIDQIRCSFEKEGYELLSKEYVNARTKLKYICPNGHTGFVRWGNWQYTKTKCLKCAAEKRAAKYYRKPFEEILKAFESEGYKLLTRSYKNCDQKLKCICPNGHNYQISWHCWNSGIRCPKCFDGSSKWEKIVREFIDEINVEYISNDRTVLINPNTNTPLELDIWMPNINKAIECNGVYWHSFDNRKNIDDIKKQLCEKLGIELLVITDDEWTSDEKICKQTILDFIKPTGE